MLKTSEDISNISTITGDIIAIIVSMSDVIDAACLATTCHDLNWITDYLKSTLDKKDPYVVGNIFKLDRWYCDFDTLTKYGHRGLVKYTNTPDLCLMVATDHDIILDLIEMKGDELNAYHLDNAILQGYLDILIKYGVSLDYHRSYALMSSSFELYEYVYSDKSLLSEEDYRMACDGSNKAIILDILKYVPLTVDNCSYLYNNGDEELVKLAMSKRDPTFYDLSSACYHGNLCAVKLLAPLMRDKIKDINGPYTVAVLRELIKYGYQDAEDLMLAGFETCSRDLLIAGLNLLEPNHHYSLKSCISMFDQISDDDCLTIDAAKIFGNKLSIAKTAVAIIAYKYNNYKIIGGVTSMFGCIPTAIRFAGACMGGNMTMVLSTGHHLSNTQIKCILKEAVILMSRLPQCSYQYLVDRGIINCKKLVAKMYFNVKQLRIIAKRLGKDGEYARVFECMPKCAISYDMMFAMKKLGISVICSPNIDYSDKVSLYDD